MNRLFFGDNLDVLRKHIQSDSIDLIYLDPPFNSNRSYNVLFRSHAGEESQAQLEAFDDTWHWSQQADDQYAALIGGGAPIRVADAIEAMRKLLGTSDVLAYLVMMTSRLVELHRVLKPTGSMFLHCDPTASHYLKVILDAVFGPENFKNEIIWHYFNKIQGNVKKLAADHDVIFWYSKTAVFTFHPVMEEREGGPAKMLKRKWDSTTQKLVNDKDEHGHVQYIERTHRMSDDVWRLPMLQPASREKLGYPTQKPKQLLERIIAMASNEGDVVLDPFCGCGTTIDAAQKLNREWVGIDITYLAVDLIRKRLRHTYGDDIEKQYTVRGIPTDLAGAEAMFKSNPFEFERWAVSLVDGQPNEKQVGDKGVDGRVRFYAAADKVGTCLVSVKGGKQLNPGMVRDLVGTVEQQKADMGLLIVFGPITKGMQQVADQSGSYVNPLSGTRYPKVQIMTIADLLSHKKPAMPEVILPYVKAKPYAGTQGTLL